MVQVETEDADAEVGQPETQDAKAEVREATMRILKLLVNNPKTRWVNDYPDTYAEISAAAMLKQAGYLDHRGRITLAGSDYHRKETADPFLTWWNNNWFGAIVAFCTLVSTIVLTCTAV